MIPLAVIAFHNILTSVLAILVVFNSLGADSSFPTF